MISSLAVQVLLWNLSDYDGGSLLNSEHVGGQAKTPTLAASTKLQVSAGLCTRQPWHQQQEKLVPTKA